MAIEFASRISQSAANSTGITPPNRVAENFPSSIRANDFVTEREGLAMSDLDPEAWHQQQVSDFNNSRGNHAQIAQVLESVLKAIARRTDPSAIVQVRPKSLASFSEKAVRKKNKYSNPVKQLTDVVGGRIITYTQLSADRLCRQIESLSDDRPNPQIEGPDKKCLLIDWDNTTNTAERLKPEEFGYKAMHYVVQLKPPNVLGIPVNNWMFQYKVEIQVCTMMQHVWAAIGHDRVYKPRYKINDALKRRLSAISALIETAQAEFESGIVVLDRYREEFACHLDADSRQDEELIWTSVIKVEPYDGDARRKLGEHYASLGQWKNAFEQFSKCDDDTPTILAKRGRAAARLGQVDKAQTLLLQAIDKDKGDWSARCDLAELLANRGESEGAFDQYREAFERAPGEPRVLVGFVTAVVYRERHLSCTIALHGALDAAIEEDKRRAELQVDLPNAYLRIGRCYLYRGGLYSALDAYCKASLTCESLELIEAEREDIERVLASLKQGGHSHDKLESYECVAKLLGLLNVIVSRRLQKSQAQVGQSDADSPPDPLLDPMVQQQLEALATRQPRPDFAKRPVVIVAGGCDTKIENRLQTYRATINGAFEHFEGTVICGGTNAGISRVIGEVVSSRGAAITAIGYLPPAAQMPDGDVRDTVNYQIFDVDAGLDGYSAAGPIQTWADLLLADVKPCDVRLLGINGGKLSGFEFRLAMAMGSAVGLIEDSGRAVSTLLTDPDWRRLGRLAALLNEAETIAAFVSAFCPTLQAIDEAERKRKLESLAKAQHEKYRETRLANEDYVHPSILPWAPLDESYKQSSNNQAAYADRILRTEGFAIVLMTDSRPAVDLGDPQYKEALNRMAQREHGRFNAERLADGWQYGPDRNVQTKKSPYLVPWEKLSPEVQGWDRDPFTKMPALLETLELKIVRLDEDGAAS
jgi:ppGpp synthetase/RelA/SpoT-type nucleotidyltranferase